MTRVEKKMEKRKTYKTQDEDSKSEMMRKNWKNNFQMLVFTKGYLEFERTKREQYHPQ